MNTNGGKGYFYSMGAKDGNRYREPWCPKLWPAWAKNAYVEGFYGRCCP